MHGFKIFVIGIKKNLEACGKKMIIGKLTG